MNSISKVFAYTAVGFFSLCGAVFAAPCGGAGLPACDVPEPNSLGLVALAVAGVVLVARKIKK